MSKAIKDGLTIVMQEKFYYKETEYRYVESEDLIYLLNTSEAKENSNRDASKTSKNRYMV